MTDSQGTIAPDSDPEAEELDDPEPQHADFFELNDGEDWEWAP